MDCLRNHRTGSWHHARSFPRPGYRARPPRARISEIDSGALGLAYVADGKSDAYAELHMHAWDCLAGLLLVREAGGVVAPFLERDGLAKGGAVLAAAPGVAEGISRATGIRMA